MPTSSGCGDTSPIYRSKLQVPIWLNHLIIFLSWWFLIPTVMTLAPFSREAIELLKQLGYKYMVVDKASLTAYARREKTPQENLDLLSLQEHELGELNLKVNHFDIDRIEVPRD